MRNWLITVCLFLSLSGTGCKAPPIPLEAKEAETQENNLWRAGAQVYASQDYQRYKESYRQAKNKLNQEKRKLIWFRKYKPVQLALRNILDEGVKLQEKVEKEKETKSNRITGQLASLKNRIDAVKKLSLMTKESRLARSAVMSAELIISEVDFMKQKGNLLATEERLNDVSLYIKKAEDIVTSALAQYVNESSIRTWKKWVDETISESIENDSVVIIISKLERKLTVYKKGKAVGTYMIGFSRNGLSDKLHSGDFAIPEGKYQIIKKLPSIRYHKALLMSYPSQEDLEEFNSAKMKGLLPEGVSIGDSIEIHGGGNDSLTYGCISLENRDLDRIFDIVQVGTPVTIVRALGNPKKLLLRKKGL
jgi:hypothetical protein